MSEIIITVPIDELKKVIVDTIRSEMQNNATDKPPEKDLITRKETAKILGISLVTLHEWTKKGLIPAYRISSRVRYVRSEILDAVTKIHTLKYQQRTRSSYFDL